MWTISRARRRHSTYMFVTGGNFTVTSIPPGGWVGGGVIFLYVPRAIWLRGVGERETGLVTDEKKYT